VSDGSGGKVEITLLKLIDPGQDSSQFASPSPAGTRYVGADFKLVSIGSSAFASADSVMYVSASGTNGQTYNSYSGTDNYPGPISLVGCPSLANVGVYALQPGQSVTGCVTLEVPSGVAATKIIFSEPGGSPVQWTIP
jgi:hypothetical protein